MDITLRKCGLLTDTDLPGMIYSYRKLRKDLILTGVNSRTLTSLAQSTH